MPKTGWMGGDEPEDEAPAMPLTNLLMSRRHGQQQPGAVLETSLARARAAEAREVRDEAAAARDPDERAANLVTRGYMPGMTSQLSMKLADTEAELADDEDKLEKAARRAERTRQMHERGQLDVSGVIARMAATDDGDETTVARLRRRADSLRRQIGEASEIMVPPEARARNAVEEASSRARRILADVTSRRAADDEAESASRTQLASDRAAFYGARGRRPFASRGDAAEPDCPECQAIGASAEESFAIHHSDADGNPLAAEPELAGSEGVAGRGERWPVSYDDMGREITRAVGYGGDGVLDNYSPVSYR